MNDKFIIINSLLFTYRYNEYVVGSLVSYSCYSGYKLTDNSTKTITCQSNKTCTQSTPNCTSELFLLLLNFVHLTKGC